MWYHPCCQVITWCCCQFYFHFMILPTLSHSVLASGIITSCYGQHRHDIVLLSVLSRPRSYGVTTAGFILCYASVIIRLYYCQRYLNILLLSPLSHRQCYFHFVLLPDVTLCYCQCYCQSVLPVLSLSVLLPILWSKCFIDHIIKSSFSSCQMYIVSC